MRCDGCWSTVTSGASPDLNAARKYETTGATGAFVRKAPDGSTASSGTNSVAVALKSEADVC